MNEENHKIPNKNLQSIYDQNFYKAQRDDSFQSAEIIVPLILRSFAIKSVIDVGCGTGAWLSVFEKNGFKEIRGFDVNDLPQENYFIDKNKIQTNCDFSSSSFSLNATADMTICLEVAEHLSETASNNLIRLLVSSAPIVMFSGAYPGQTGVNHINEQPPWYWREKFNHHGYSEVDFLRPIIWTDDRIAWWYRQNITAFVSRNYLTSNVRLQELFNKYGQKPSPHRLTLVNEWILKNHVEQDKTLDQNYSKKIEELSRQVEALTPSSRCAERLISFLKKADISVLNSQDIVHILSDCGLETEADFFRTKDLSANNLAQTGGMDKSPIDIQVNAYQRSTDKERQSYYQKNRDELSLRERFLRANIPVQDATIDIVDFEMWLNNFGELAKYYSGHNDVMIEKCLEHYLAFKWLELTPKDLYIDIAASGSIWAKVLATKGLNAYRLDMIYPPGINGHDIGADASNTKLPSGFSSAMSLQCAFETFQNNADMRFISEAERVLNENGRLVILPLYTDEAHFILSSPYADLSGIQIDEGAIRVWREDEYKEPFSRHYSPEAFARRIYPQLNSMSGKVIYFSNLEELRSKYPGQRIYCDFMFYCKKTDSSSTQQVKRTASNVTQNKHMEFTPYVKKKHIEGVSFDFLIGDADGMDWYDINCGDPVWVEMRFIRDNLVEEGDIVFECGGHHGCTAIPLSAWVGEKGKVITFEPKPSNFEIIRKNIVLNNISNITALNKAVGSKNGRTYISDASNASVQSSVVKGAIEVDVIALDDLIDLHPTFLKIDVEGYEVEVLKGAKKILQNRPKLAIEIHTESLNSYNTSVRELLSLLHLDNYDCWIQWKDGEEPKKFDINQEITQRVHLFAVPKKLKLPIKSEIPYLSVIIPTLNRAGLLERALESLTVQTYPQHLFEVIVVDNGSTDNTAEVCRRFQQKIANLKCIYDERPGLHVGRHLGCETAQGKILVYGDDDIRAFPTWLEGVSECFEDETVVLAGGKILPDFESPPPPWFSRLWSKTPWGMTLGWYSLIDFSDTVKQISALYVYGCNFAIRKQTLLDLGGFHPDSLPKALLKFRGDGETFVSQSIDRNGYKVLYNPKASVYHWVSNNRMTLDYLYYRAYIQGISDSYAQIRTTKKVDGFKHFINSHDEVLNTINKGHTDGFNFHQDAVKNSPKLLEWVLKKDYFDYKLPDI